MQPVWSPSPRYLLARGPVGAAPAGAAYRRGKRRRCHPRQQHTILDPCSPARAGVAAPRKALGRIYGHAVRSGWPDGTLVVGEGIETVLSLVTALPEVTAAAALSTGSLGAFAPPGLSARLVITRDNDHEGERAAERLARRSPVQGVRGKTGVGLNAARARGRTRGTAIMKPEGATMSQVTFQRITPEESRILDADGGHVGDVYAHDDILNPGRRVYLILLDEDPRGWTKVYDRARIREVAEARLASHPYFQ